MLVHIISFVTDIDLSFYTRAVELQKFQECADTCNLFKTINFLKCI